MAERPLFQASTVQRWAVDAPGYFGDRYRTSRSMLDLFRRSPALYEHRHLLGGDDEDSAALRLGRAMHVLTLQPDRARELVVADLEPEDPNEFKGPGAKKRREAFKARYCEWRASLPTGAAILDEEQLEQARGMCDALRRHELAGKLLDRDGEAEVALEWIDNESLLPCKAMIDYHFLTASRDAVRVLELKSTSDPEPGAFMRSVVRYGYHRQNAMYADAVARLYGLPVKFLILAVRSTPPHEVAVFELDEALVDAGRRQLRSTIARFVACRNAQRWRAPWECADKPRPYLLAAPRWALEEP